MVKLGPIEIRMAGAPTGEIGGTGTSTSPSSGGGAMLTQDDYNPDLTGTKLYDEVDRMRLSDSQVKAALSVVKMPLLSASWHVEAASDSTQDKRIAEWMEDQLFNRMYHPWAWVLRHILLHLDFGTMPFELVWDIQDDPEFRQPLAVLTDLAPRMPRTITEWNLDEKGRLSNIKQSLTSTSQFSEVFIPADKLLVFVNEQEGGNYRGTSILRAARKDWLLKERAQRTNAVALEKRAAGIDVGTIAGTAQAQQKKADAEAALATIRVHERSFITETDDFSYRVQGIEGATLDPLPTIQYHDLMILRGILAEFLAMGGNSTGSLAMHKDKSSFFLMALRAIANQVTGQVNRDLIPKWMMFNFPNADHPKLSYGRLDTRDVSGLTEALSKLIPQGAITVDQGLEEELRDLLELPEMEEIDQDNLSVPIDGRYPRRSSAQRGYGYAWRKLRAEHLEIEPHCRECRTQGRGRVDASDVDHIIPKLKGGKDTHDNLQSLCHSCHSVKTRLEAKETLATRLPDFIAMADGLDRAETQIVRRYLPIQTKQITKLIDEAIKAIESGDPEKLETINVPFRQEAQRAFSQPLEGLYRQGQQEVKKEFSKMQKGQPLPVRMASPLDPADDDSVKRWLRARSRAVSNQLAERLRGAMLRHSLDMMRRGEVDRNELLGRLTALSDRDIKREAKQVTSEALNLGRESVADENRELIKAVEYSAIMDEGSCDECRSLDGTTFEMGSEGMRIATPPYRNCSGFGNPRCRCVFIYTLESESEARG